MFYILVFERNAKLQKLWCKILVAKLRVVENVASLVSENFGNFISKKKEFFIIDKIVIAPLILTLNFKN